MLTRRSRKLCWTAVARISSGQLSNNGMHPTADTPPVLFRQRLGAAGNV